MRACLLVLCLSAVAGTRKGDCGLLPEVRADESADPTPPPFPEQAAMLGVWGADVVLADSPAARAVEAFAGLGVTWVATRPVAWGELDPRSPEHPVARYDWKVLDDTLSGWQRAGCVPLLVLSPESPWACQPREGSDLARHVRERLPEADARVALAGARGAAPPTQQAWKEWKRFVRDLVERYDGDGRRDVPGLVAPLRALQVLDQVGRSSRWLGSPEEYLKLLHHAKEAVAEAGATVEVVHAAVDLGGLWSAQDGRESAWRQRLASLVPATPSHLRLEIERGLEQVQRSLDLSLAYDALVHVGSGNMALDAHNLAALRAGLDARGATNVPVYLAQGPSRRLDACPAWLSEPRVAESEARERQRLVAEGLRATEGSPARQWLRRGTAYDLVRGAALARLAGAERVLSYGPTDAAPAAQGEDGPALRHQGWLTSVPGAAGAVTWLRTASWYAARQFNRLLLGHRSVRDAPLGAPGRAVVFDFPESAPRAWVALLVPATAASWAGTLDGPGATRSVRVPLPDGEVELEEVSLADGPPVRRREVVREGLLTLPLSAAPLYVMPAASR